MYFITISLTLFLYFDVSMCNLWPKGIVHYSINPKDYDPHSQDLIVQTLGKIQNEVCVKFFNIPVNYTADEAQKVLLIHNPGKEKLCPPRSYDFNKSVIDMTIGYKCLNERDIVKLVMEMLKASIHKSETVVNSYDLLKNFQEKNKNADQASLLVANDRNYINAHYFQECGGLTQRSAPSRRQIDDDGYSEFSHQNREYYRPKVWPMGIVIFKVDPRLKSSAEMEAVLKAMRVLEAETCVLFQEAETSGDLDPKNVIVFGDDGERWPGLGFQEGEQTLKLSSVAGCEDPGHSAHALMMMMRILGIPMMSNRYDRDNYIKVNWKNVQKGEELYLEKAPEAAWLKSIPYDFSSVTHAPANFLCPGCLTTYTVEPVQDHLWQRMLQMGRRTQLSAHDVRLLGEVYVEQCQARLTPMIPLPVSGGTVQRVNGSDAEDENVVIDNNNKDGSERTKLFLGYNREDYLEEIQQAPDGRSDWSITDFYSDIY